MLGVLSLTAGATATIEVSYTVPSDTQAGEYTNLVVVSSDEPYDDPSNNEDDDTNEVLIDIDLSIVKTFDPTSVPQGTIQTFTIVVSNAGPSDAVDVSVTDTVHESLEVIGVEVTFEIAFVLARQTIRCLDSVPEIAKFVKDTALMGNVGIEIIESSNQATAPIMNE